MATGITSECINCGACEPECPNTAIYQGGVEWEHNGVNHPAIAADIFYIVPEKCTECVGFYDHEACAAVCPVDCCIPDPARPESEEILIARARELHPDKAFASEFPSRFRKDGAEAPVAGEAPSQAHAEPAVTSTAAVAAPASIAAPTTEVSNVAIPEIEDWEVPIECIHCHGTYAVAFRHFRSGVVFYCPFCQGSYVVTTSMHAHVSHALQQFHVQWLADFDKFQERRRRELEQFEERQRMRLEDFNQSLRQASLDFHPPGAPRKRAGIFG
jgi:ferredoxin